MTQNSESPAVTPADSSQATPGPPAGPSGAGPGAPAGFSRTDVEMLAVVLFWAFNFSVAKPALEEIAPQVFNFIRFVAASVLLLILTRALDGPLRIRREDWGRLALLGFVGHAVYQICFIEGLARTAASSAALLYGATPVIVGLMSHMAKHERIRHAGAFGALLGFFGVYMVVQGRSGGAGAAGESTLAGNLFIVAAIICWSIYTVVAHGLLQRYSPLRVTGVTVTIGMVLMLPPAIPSLVAQEWKAVSFGAWLRLSYSCLFALVICYILWYRSVKKAGNIRTAVYSNLVPVFGTFFGVWLLDERLTGSVWIGAACILGAIILTRIDQRGR